MRLWDTSALEALYVREAERLASWMARREELDPAAAARESYLLGRQAITDFVFDPWLPAPFVDTDARHHYFKIVCRYDEVGRAIWTGLIGRVESIPVGYRVDGAASDERGMLQ